MHILSRVVHLQKGEAPTAWLMFAYSYLAMAAYNIVKPITRAAFIVEHDSIDLPYVQLAAGIVIGVIMHGYAGAIGRLPRRWVIPATQGVMIAVLLVFWLLFRFGAPWTAAAFYIFSLMLGLLLISQFWTLANDIYDARQARRLFGFIGGGACLGGATGAGLTGLAADAVGTYNLLLVSAAALLLCLLAGTAVIRRQPTGSVAGVASKPKSVGGGEAIRMLRQSRHLQVISLLIAFAAIGAVFIEQQLNMAAQAKAAEAATDSTAAIAVFLADVNFYLSLVGFVVQVGLTSRIHRTLGLTFALLLLPVSLGLTAGIILVSTSTWAPAVARVLDGSLRYSVDKTTREVLFLPLPADLKYRAKPFVDVTIDRFAKALGAVALLVLIQPWGLELTYSQISYASLAVMAASIGCALIARREYLRAFRRSLDLHELEPATVRFDVAEAGTVQALVDELSKPDEASVLYAIDMLETLGRQELITPLLLRHESAAVRSRVLAALRSTEATRSESLMTTIQTMLDDPDVGVRAAAVRVAVANRRDQDPDAVRVHLEDAEPRVAVAAAVELADSDDPADRSAAEATLARLAMDPRPSAAPGRCATAAGLSQIANPAFRSLLIPLIHDPNVEVAREAVASATAIGASDALFVPALVSLLGHRELKQAARAAIVSYGEEIVGVLAYVLMDRDEPAWVRRHIPATLARIPTQAAMDALVRALDEPDGFLRYKVIVAIETLRRTHPALTYSAAVIEQRIVGETARYYTHLTLRHNLVERDASREDSLLVTSLSDKLDRTLDRIYRLLGLLHPWRDVAAARYAIERGHARARAGGLEYLDNVLTGIVRRRVMPILDTAPLEDKVRHANSVLKSRPRDVSDTVAQLVHEDDPVVAASAVHFVVRRHLLSTLSDDLWYILARGVADPLVRDAAEWAVSTSDARAPAATTGALPVVEVADRLRAIELFAFVSIDELLRIAAAAEQVRPAPGELYRQGAPATEVLFLLDGVVRVTGGDPAPASIAAPAAVNLADVLEDRPLRHSLVSDGPIIAITLSAPSFLTMLGDNIATAQGLFRMLLASPSALDWMAMPSGHAAPATEPNDGADPIDVARRLRQTHLFGRATIDQLQDLVAATRTTTLTRGKILWSDGLEPAVYHLLQGEITVTTDDAPTRRIGPGETIGIAETLTGTSPGRRAVVTVAGLALRLDRDDLFEVLADHGDLLQSVFRSVLGDRRG